LAVPCGAAAFFVDFALVAMEEICLFNIYVRAQVLANISRECVCVTRRWLRIGREKAAANGATDRSRCCSLIKRRDNEARSLPFLRPIPAHESALLEASG